MNANTANVPVAVSYEDSKREGWWNMEPLNINDTNTYQQYQDAASDPSVSTRGR